LARKEVQQKTPRRIMFCSMTDPYQLMEAELGLVRDVLKVLLESQFLVLIMTKSNLVTRDYDIIRGHYNVEVGFTITSLSNLPNWEPAAPGNTIRIEALKKAHELGIKTFVIMEPTIPDETKPLEIMQALEPWVDRWIIGSLNYMRVNRDFYCKEVPKWAKYIDKTGLPVTWKKELQSYRVF
jgi:DNA repair photolyase